MEEEAHEEVEEEAPKDEAEIEVEDYKDKKIGPSSLMRPSVVVGITCIHMIMQAAV